MQRKPGISYGPSTAPTKTLRYKSTRLLGNSNSTRTPVTVQSRKYVFLLWFPLVHELPAGAPALPRPVK